MKFTKVISTLAAVTVCGSALSAFSAPVYAAGDVTISVDTVSAAPGKEFSVDVKLSNVPADGIAGLEFAVKYDSSLVTVTSVTEGSISKTGASEAELDKDSGLADSAVNDSYSALSYNIDEKNSAVNLIWLTGLSSSDYYIKKDGVFVTINGQVKESASGKAELEVVPISRTGLSGSTTKVYVSIGGSDTETVPKVTNGAVAIEDGNASSDTTTQGGSSSEATLLGDATCDGNVDVKDIANISQYIVKLKTISDQGLVNADVIVDGEVNIKDLSQIKRYLIKEIQTL